MNDEEEYCTCCSCLDREHWTEEEHRNDLDDCGECHTCYLPIRK